MLKFFVNFLKAVKIFFQLGPEKIIKLQEEAIKDFLTGLYNRRHLEEIAPKEIARAARYGHFLSVIMIDIDGFKAINDTLGHNQGDEVLKSVSHAFEWLCRETDYIFRWGGDEFILLLPETSEDGAKEVMERLEEKLNEKDLFISYGIISLNSGFTTFKEMVYEADTLMYQHKNGKKLKR